MQTIKKKDIDCNFPLALKAQATASSMNGSTDLTDHFLSCSTQSKDRSSYALLLSETLHLLHNGDLSLMEATSRLSLPDAGHVLSLMREHGVRIYQASNKEALARAIQTVISSPHGKSSTHPS